MESQAQVLARPEIMLVSLIVLIDGAALTREVGPHLTNVADEKENHCMATIFETVRAQGDCSMYVRGIESTAGLAEILRGPGPFTLFVPFDAAFDRLSSDKRASLFADPEKLSKVLRYHIVPGSYTANDLLDRLFLKTLEGARLRVWSDISMVPLGEKEIDTHTDALNFIASETVTIAVQKSITINGGHVIRADVKADNGILHVLDKVLLPPFTRL